MKILYAIIVFISIDGYLCRSVVQFCDQNFVDAVLWDGIDYKVTRNDWIATYDPRAKSVEFFTHISEYHFPNGKLWMLKKIKQC